MRDKIESGLPKQVPSEKRDEIADKVVSGMREGGVLGDEDELSTCAETDDSDGVEHDREDADASKESAEVTASA